MTLTENGDGTVTDSASGLMWQVDDDGLRRNQAEALDYCRSLALAGYRDWRLPTLHEFRTLKDAVAQTRSSLPVSYSPNGDVYWTATNAPSDFPADVAYGADGTTFYRSYKFCVRAVRG